MTSTHPLTISCSSWIPAVYRAFQTQCPSAEEVRGVVLTHLQEKEILDSSLPSSIIIGPFYINVDNVKQSLSKKRKALATSMLDILAKNLHKEVDDVSAHLLGPSDCTNSHQCTHSELPQARLRGVCRLSGPWKGLEVTLPQPCQESYGRSQEVGAAIFFPGLVKTWEALTKVTLRCIILQS